MNYRRIARQYDGAARKDFMTRILQQRDPAKTSDLQLAAHASDFVIAGSETTATALSCILNYLLRDPAALARLQEEIRGHFGSYAEITALSTLRLRYLRAVILEGLRIYPPLPFGLPRVVPEGGDTVDGHFLPGGVSHTHHHHEQHCHLPTPSESKNHICMYACLCRGGCADR